MRGETGMSQRYFDIFDNRSCAYFVDKIQKNLLFMFCIQFLDLYLFVVFRTDIKTMALETYEHIEVEPC